MTYTTIELLVLSMIAEGRPLHGHLREIAIDLAIEGRLPAGH